MAQLQEFLTDRNEHWFRAPKTYWHRAVFAA